jgi:hypothetical protein
MRLKKLHTGTLPVTSDESCALTPRFDLEVRLRHELTFTAKDFKEFMKRPIRFVGSMHDKVRCCKAELPDTLNWALTQFKRWNPVIFGPALRNTLAKKQITDVHMLANANVGSDVERSRLIRIIRDEIGAKLDQAWTAKYGDPTLFLVFKHDGLRYHLWFLHTGFSEFSQNYYWSTTLEPSLGSADRLRCETQNELTGTRIAILDASRGVSRSTQPDRGDSWIATTILSEQLVNDGFLRIPYPSVAK